MNADESVQIAMLVERVGNLTEVVKDLKGEFALIAKEQETSRLDRLTLHNENDRLTRRTDAMENLHHDHVADDDIVHDKLDIHLGEHAKQADRSGMVRDALGTFDKVLIRVQAVGMAALGIYVTFFK